MISVIFRNLVSASYLAMESHQFGGAPKWRSWISEKLMFASYWVYENCPVDLESSKNARSLIQLSLVKVTLLIQYGIIPPAVDELRDAIRHEAFTRAGVCWQKAILFNRLGILLCRLKENPESSLLCEIQQWKLLGDTRAVEFAEEQLKLWREKKEDAFVSE